MPSDPQGCLREILAHLEQIQSFTDGLSLPEYQADLRTRLAVERLLQMMTEAAYRLGPAASVLCPDVDWNGIRGLGNFLRHEYDRVSDEIIWTILRDRLPMLRDAVQRALKQPEPRQGHL